MLTKCANPTCSAQFRYFHEGKLFHSVANDKCISGSGQELVPSQKILYFWLCSACSSHMTLEFAPGGRVLLLPAREAHPPIAREMRQ